MPLGWHISVYRQQNDGTAPAMFGAPHGTRLSVWQTGLGGLDWLDELVKQGRAIQLSRNGYPTEYTVTAAHVIPNLHGTPPGARSVWVSDPGDVLTGRWLGRTTQDSEVIAACRPDEWLIIQAWDES